MSVKHVLALFLAAGLASGGRGADGDWEKLSDGSTGKETSYRGVGDVVIPAYIRKPKGDGPFPAVVILHGGMFSKQATMSLGRSSKSPFQDFINAGWAVYAIADNGPHGFYYGRPGGPEYKEATKRAVAFFEKCFNEQLVKKEPGKLAAQEAQEKKPAEPRSKAKTKYKYGTMEWVDPDKTDTEFLKFKTFRSGTIKANVSYMVYLPPDYEKKPEARYPVLYNLHASGGTSRRDGAEIARRFDEAIRAGRVDPLIIVCPNGLRGATMYSDSKDGEYPVETVIIKDLIPHIDATYRTVATRTGRALDGFSMGGFGAAHLGFKYPELFAVVSIQAPPLLGPDLKQPLPVHAWSNLFPTAMGGDLEYFKTNDPFELIVKNADALRDRSMIRIVTHVENENWLAPRCEELHQLLMKHSIAHQFFYLSNVKSHSRGACLNTLGDAGLAFFGSSFAYLQKPSGGKKPK